MTKINIKNKKTKTYLALVGAIVIGLMISSPVTMLPYVNATTTAQNSIESSACVDKVQQEAMSMTSGQDKIKAKSLAESQSEFKAKIQGYKSTFNSVFNEWSFDTNCNLAWKDVGVAYTLSNSTGVVKNVVVLLNPSLTRMLNVTEQETGFMTNVPHHDGWDFYALSGMTQVNVWEAKDTWSQTTVTQPAPGYCVSPTPCALSTWPGLSAFPGGTSNDLAQAGTTGQITCGHSGCNTINYFAWYEFLPANYVTCPSFTLHAGDTVTADVVNHGKTGGSTTLYDVSVVDSNSGSMCTNNNVSYNVASPSYAIFLSERPVISSVQQSLPKFTSITQTGTMYYSGASHSISVPYNAGTRDEYVMNNGQGNNISHTGAGSGSYTQTWLTSAGT